MAGMLNMGCVERRLSARERSRRRQGLFVVSIAGVLAFASNASAADAAASCASEVTAAAQAFDDAQFAKDAAAIDRFLAADFKFVRSSGKFTDRADFIAGFTDPNVKFEPFVVTNRMCIPLGPDAAIIGGEGTIRGTEKGKPFVEHFRYADSFQRREGRWQVVYVQVTPIKAE